MSPTGERLVRRTALVALFALVAWYVVVELRGQWTDFRRLSVSLAPSWSLLGASGGIVLAAYALLIEVWRRLVAVGGREVPFWRAARVWFVSSFGKYVPGKVWAIAAMGALAEREGVAPGVAAGAAILNQAINVAAGFAVVAATASGALPALFPNVGRGLAIGAVVLAVAGLLALPVVLPPAVATLSRRLKRPVAAPIPVGVLWLAIVGNVVGWMMYGLAFHVFAEAIGASPDGHRAEYVAVFTASYLAGYLAVLAPGGLVIREAAMIASLTALGLTTTAQATVLAFTSRLWLTALEITPGVLLILYDIAFRTSRSRAAP